MHTLRQRLNARDESGFTLIELLVVLIIIGILLAIAIPSYLGFQKSAQQTAAAADVRQAVPDATAYYADNQTYTGISDTALQSYDSGLRLYSAGPPQVPGILNTVKTNSAADTANGLAVGQEFCISAEDNGYYAGVAGPGGVVIAKLTADPCAAWTGGVSSPGATGWTP